MNRLISKSVNLILTRSLNYRPIESKNKIKVGHQMTKTIEKYREKFLLKKIAKERSAANSGETNRVLSKKAQYENRIPNIKKYQNYNETQKEIFE